MKKQLTLFTIAFMILTAMAYTAISAQQRDAKQKNEQQQPGKGNNSGKDKGQKNNKGKSENAGMNSNAGNGRANNAEKNDRSAPGREKNEGRANNDNPGDRGKKMKDDRNDIAINARDIDVRNYKWSRETFRERDKIKGGKKVTICHKFNSNEPAVTISVSENALKAHINHGDVVGDCPPAGNRWSDIFIRRRNNYYDVVQRNQEQVYYSRSILDYALSRLADSRSQLVVMQNNNAPAAEIQRRQASVLELEQNVSLLETLIGAATAVVVNKLM